MRAGGRRTEIVMKYEHSHGVWATANESARTLLPPLDYLVREAQAAELNEVAAILEMAIDDISAWIDRTTH